jgi:hypothetical protein
MRPAITPPASRRFISDLSRESNSLDGDQGTTPPKRSLDGGPGSHGCGEFQEATGKVRQRLTVLRG